MTLQKAREAVAQRDARIEELTRAHARLQRLYEISTMLTRFKSVQQTVPEVVTAIARALPLRSAVLTLKAGDARQTITWLADGEAAQRLREAEIRADAAFRYLVGSEAAKDCVPVTPLKLPAPLANPPTRTDGLRSFVSLPLAVERHSVRGALQIEGACDLDERDLVFVNAVVNQLSVALDHDSADAALRASEAKLSGLVSIAADAIVSIDENQRIIVYNEGAEKIFGWSRGEVLGKPIDMLLPERLRDAHRRHLPEFAAQREAARRMGYRHGAISGLRKSGEEFPAEAAISKLRIGDSWMFTAILRDVTEQERNERAERFLDDLATVLAATLDFNDTLTDLAQVVTRELADWCIVDFVDDHDDVQRLHVASADPKKAGMAEALQQFPLDRRRPHLSSEVLRSGQPQLIAHVSPADLAALAQGEEHRRLLEAVAPKSLMAVPMIVHGRLLGALTVVSTRPNRRYGAAELRLLEEVGHRSALALQNARLYRALSRAVQMRDDVLGIVAHDLRSPLHSILMASDMLVQGEPKAKRGPEEPADAIRRSALRMDRLIQDLLDVTRMTSGHLSIEPTPLSAALVIEDAVAAESLLAASDSVDLRLDLADALPDVWADRDRLLQVFDNLIGNALKFTPPGGCITVGAAPADGAVLFWVADTGPGIAATDLPHLFDRFWQARRTGRRGAGLGLPIVKGIVDAHGGRVWVESAHGCGATFFCTIPTAHPTQPSGC